jgi:hypothetical protein
MVLLGPNLAMKGFTPVNYQGSQDYRRCSIYLTCGNLVIPLCRWVAWLTMGSLGNEQFEKCSVVLGRAQA